MKKIRRILVGMIAMVMILGCSLTAMAASGTTYVKVSKVTGIKGSKTIYTDAVPVNWTISYQISSKTAETLGVEVRSDNRGVVRVGEPDVTRKGKKFTAKVQLTPVANGKATITVYDKLTGAKKKAVKVTVKTHVTEINVANEEAGSVKIAKNGKLKLQTSVNGNASNKKLTYSVTAGKAKATVNKQGVVTLKSGAKVGDTVKVRIKASDKKKGAYYTDCNIEVVPQEVTKISLVADKTTSKPGYGELTKKNKKSKAYTLKLKGNKSSEYKFTYKLNLGENLIVKGTDSSEVTDYSLLSFSSSKPDVASISDDGKIMAYGSGSTTITVMPVNGTKNATAKFTVKVDTDVNTMNFRTLDNKTELLANGKDTITFIATTNQNASKTGIKYAIASITKSDGGNVAKKQWKKYATISSKGVLKAKKVCSIKVTATSKGDKSFKDSITVAALSPVTSLKIEAGAGTDSGVTSKTTKKVTTYTMYKEAAEAAEKPAYNKLILNAKVNGTAEKSDIVWSSSNVKVANVVDGTIIANGNGTAKITAKELLSGKSASVNVTVKTDAYIAVPKASMVEGKAFVYVKDTDSHEVDFEKAIGAVVRGDVASKVVYKIGTEVVTKRTILATDNPVVVRAETSAAGKVSGAPVGVDVSVKVITADTASSDYKFVDETIKAYAVKEGETFAIPAEATAIVGKDGKVVTEEACNVTWSVNKVKNKSNPYLKISSDGVLTGVKPGTATVTAKLGSINLSRDFEITVGRTDKAVLTAFDKAFAAEIKAEKRDFMGAGVTYKNGAIVFTVVEPNQEIEKLKGIGSGLTDSAKKVLGPGFDGMTISTGADSWYAKRQGASLIVTNPDGTVTDPMNEATAIDYVLKKSIGDDKKQLRDWVGTTYSITIDIKENNLLYSAIYGASVALKDKVQENMADLDISGAIAKLDSLGIAGIESVEYNGAKNVITVVANNGKQNVAETDRVFRSEITKIIAAPLKDVVSVKVVANLPKKDPVTVTEERKATGISAEESISNLIAKYMSRLQARNIKTYADADGAVANILVTYKYGSIERDVVYTMSFGLSPETVAVEASEIADAAIAAAIAAAGENYTYDKATSTVTATYKDDANILSLATGELGKIVDAMIKSGNVDTTRDIIMRLGDKTASFKASETTLVIFKKLADSFGIEKLSDLKNQPVTVSVPYSHGVALTYTIKFNILDSVDETADAEVAKAVEEAGKAGNEYAEYAYDKETNTVTATYKKNVKIEELATAAMGEILEAMIKSAGVDATRDITVTLDGKTATFKAADTTIAKFKSIADTFKIEKVSDLKDKAFAVAVPYKNNTSVAYTIAFNLDIRETVEANADAEVGSAVEDANKAGGDYKYDKDTNTVTATYTDDVKVEDLATGAMGTILRSMIKDTDVDAKENIVATLGEAEIKFTATETKEEIFKKIATGLSVTMINDLKDKEITVSVPYEGGVVLTYTIKFDVKIAEPEPAVNSSVEAEGLEVTMEEADNAVETEESISEQSSEESSIEESSIEETAEEDPIEDSEELIEEAAVEAIIAE